MGEWYYIGHYGQLGPLTRDQFDELIDQEVIVRDTYVWRAGMSEWVYACQCTELSMKFHAKVPQIDPPPPPGAPLKPMGPALADPPMQRNPRISTSTGTSNAPIPYASYAVQQNVYFLKSTKSRIAGGVIQLVLPFGIGRMYMGYWGIGLLQLFTTFCFGIGALWCYIDGIVILCGGVKTDGYGRIMD